MDKITEIVHEFKVLSLEASKLGLTVHTSQSVICITDGKNNFECYTIDELRAFILGYTMSSFTYNKDLMLATGGK